MKFEKEGCVAPGVHFFPFLPFCLPAIAPSTTSLLASVPFFSLPSVISIRGPHDAQVQNRDGAGRLYQGPPRAAEEAHREANGLPERNAPPRRHGLLPQCATRLQGNGCIANSLSHKVCGQSLINGVVRFFIVSSLKLFSSFHFYCCLKQCLRVPDHHFRA